MLQEGVSRRYLCEIDAGMRHINGYWNELGNCSIGEMIGVT
jgi:hypothetical protein